MTVEDVKTAFFEVQDQMKRYIKNCSDNVRVVIYMDSVLDDPLVFVVGPGDNKLIITIREDGTIFNTWTKETFSKVYNDGWDAEKNLVCTMVSMLFKKFPVLKAYFDRGEERAKRKAIEYK